MEVAAVKHREKLRDKKMGRSKCRLYYGLCSLQLRYGTAGGQHQPHWFCIAHRAPMTGQTRAWGGYRWTDKTEETGS